MSKIQKPDPEGIANYVGGYCLGVTMNTQKIRVITPTDCVRIMKGEGFFYTSNELKKLLAFGNTICDQTKMCKEDAQKAENEKFYEFLNKPEEMRKFLKDKAK